MQATSSRPRRPTRLIPSTPDGVPTDPLQAPAAPPAINSKTSTPDEFQADQANVLTPLRAHYLKKSLVQLQFSRELDAITTATPNNISTFSYLGAPFTPPPKDAPPVDLPFLRFIFRQFILTFPLMAAAPKDFYSDKLQPFMTSVLSRNLSPTSVLDDGDESEQATRMKLLAKLERNLSLFVGSATKLVEQEEVVRLSQSDLDRLEMLAKKRQARVAKVKDIFEVNIIGVRTVVDKGRMRSRVHEEFIIRTRRSHMPDIFVSRRYGDFKTLAEELRKAHPNELIRSPPAKDRTTVSAPPPSAPAVTPAPTFMSRMQAMSSDVQFPSQTWGDSNLSNDSFQSMQQPSPSQQNFNTPSRLAREKNRLTLRAYLHSLMGSSAIANSPVLKSFLLSGPTTLNEEEIEDSRRREDADNVREDGRKQFAKEIAARVDALRDAVKSVQGDVMGPDGLTHVFATVKTTPDVHDLPDNYQAVLEWARISLASTVFHQFVAADNSSETFAGLKRIHGLMPYFMLKAALKISNPVGMIRSILDLFLAQPFGGRSLLQRMFTSSLTEEVKALEEDIEAVKDKIDDPVMSEKIRLFVYAPRDIQVMFKEDAAAEKLNLLAVVLRSGDEPVLNRPQMQRVVRAHRAHTAYLKTRESLADSDDDDGPQDDDAWLFEDLKILTQLYSRLRDREQLIALLFEGVTSELLKDIITIFYAPLAQVYRAASIADSLGDLQNFINDLIKTVEQVEELSQEDPQRTVQTFIDLVQRHEQAFYSFVHKVHSKGEGLFDSLMRWIELFLTIVREGLGGDPISLEFLLPHTGLERKNILKEVDAVALYHYKLKVAYENKIRRRFGKIQVGTDADAEDEATQALVQGVVGEISFGELIQGDADDVAAEDSDDSDNGSSSEYETDTGDSDDSEGSTESTEESAEPPPVARAHTLQHPSRHHHAHTPRPGSEPQPPAQGDGRPPRRPRALSLKSLTKSTSMIFNSKPHSAHGHSSNGQSARSSHELSAAPPVPPLPLNIPAAAFSKPLPPSPAPERPSVSERRSQPERSSPRLRSQKAKKTPETLKPPDLHHLPQLLPVFTEMMRPLLRPRHS